MSSDNICIKNWYKHFAMSKIVAARWWHSLDANYWGEAALTYKGIIKKRLEQADKQGRRYEGNRQSPRLVSGDNCV